jgi:hypothetical protein
MNWLIRKNPTFFAGHAISLHTIIVKKNSFPKNTKKNKITRDILLLQPSPKHIT